MTGRVMSVRGDLPGSGRAFRLAVADRALGVWVSPAREGADPFVAIVNHAARSVTDAEDLVEVVRSVTTP